jgi:hypothetical protein
MLCWTKVAVCYEIHKKKHMHALCGQSVQFVNVKFGVSFEMWCWRRMQKISWTGRVKYELHRVKKERSTLRTIKRRKVNWIGHILRGNCLLKHVIEGKIERIIKMTGRRGRRCKQLLYNFKEKRRRCKLKEEALDRTLWRTRFGRGYGPVVRRTAE